MFWVNLGFCDRDVSLGSRRGIGVLHPISINSCCVIDGLICVGRGSLLRSGCLFSEGIAERSKARCQCMQCQCRQSAELPRQPPGGNPLPSCGSDHTSPFRNPMAKTVVSAVKPGQPALWRCWSGFLVCGAAVAMQVTLACFRPTVRCQCNCACIYIDNGSLSWGGAIGAAPHEA